MYYPNPITWPNFRTSDFSLNSNLLSNRAKIAILMRFTILICFLVISADLIHEIIVWHIELNSNNYWFILDINTNICHHLQKYVITASRRCAW